MVFDVTHPTKSDKVLVSMIPPILVHVVYRKMRYVSTFNALVFISGESSVPYALPLGRFPECCSCIDLTLAFIALTGLPARVFHINARNIDILVRKMFAHKSILSLMSIFCNENCRMCIPADGNWVLLYIMEAK